ncbi:MAG TPA: hypothetical protein VM434_02430 [Beijerinckiaceae bacterium]|nr:hypothetical protein [Beijerinckiaceae bacterium]
MVIISRKAIALGSTITLVLVAAAHGHNAFAPAAPHAVVRPAANAPSISRQAFDERFYGERPVPKLQDRLGERRDGGAFAAEVVVLRAGKGDRLDRAPVAVASH